MSQDCSTDGHTFSAASSLHDQLNPGNPVVGVHRAQSRQGIRCELRKRTLSYSVVEGLVTSFRVSCTVDGSGALAGANQPASRPEKVSRPAIVASIWKRVGAMAKTATGVHCGFWSRSGYLRREEALLFSGSCGASCEAGGVVTKR